VLAWAAGRLVPYRNSVFLNIRAEMAAGSASARIVVRAQNAAPVSNGL